ncbi:alpha/beta hydrolase [Ktedonobacter racemifer]|uniref:Phospholipase/Carboxylesterase n=1 Tax=Ktedonobacter racemifer DSM 44963 TaxID=485913 RepID=D6TWH1_KTERA|nr:dienelactone hydrolase family protein [Ktedonobacter racemifer]EFH84554.1 phospholipase/Carboxylesterase [Ktedonobacter racemifer DSM 44963]
MEQLHHLNNVTGPHQGQPVLAAGLPLKQAKAVMIMLHGRGASAEDILSLASELHQPGFTYLAPQAAGYSWYPNSFLAPLASNEPHLTSALAVIASLLAQAVDAGIEPERTILLGFSQGACLALEFVARNARRYGGVAGLSGGLIGPDGTPRNYPGSFDGTPMFLGCSDRDFHIPKERVEYSAQVLQRMGGQVTARLYPNMGHTINQDEIHVVQAMMAAL